MKYWWSADTHFSHFNIIRYCERPFKTIKQMNETIVKNWNKRVKEEDTVYFLGDWCFKNSPGGKIGEGEPFRAKFWEDQLNGKIIFINGNHDRNNSVRSLIQSMVIKYGSHYINCVHNPDDYNENYVINFVGHVHQLWKFKRIYNPQVDRNIDLINVGVDCNNFQPVTFEELYSGYKRWVKAGCK